MNVTSKSILVKVTIDMAFFFEMSDDSVLDPDVAVEMLESLSSHLKKMSDIEKTEFHNLIREESKKYQGSEREEFVLNLPEMLGII